MPCCGAHTGPAAILDSKISASQASASYMLLHPCSCHCFSDDMTSSQECNMLVCRPDRMSFAATQYVESELGSRFVEPPMLDLTEALADSTCTAPLIFVLSPGIDPTEPLQKLAASVHMSERFFSVALGQGQVRGLQLLQLLDPVVQHQLQTGLFPSPRLHEPFGSCLAQHLPESWAGN